ncbi:thiolase family protein [Paractinoplanes lichenicola]|uniref:Probable acetyl-CoA acetyltransferase n=1 Tax=Paractinoplanes lichenicola TaxID=2802976 RepID=A0ABS1W4Q8_9ACTN|nr:thiolase family protein [Actinoplanes lichenicola]MBL7261721.1 thiolase family protein [Actinoplanes lichenicola]
MAEAFLVGGVRTPQGKYGGALAGVRPDDLAGLVVRQAVARAGVPADEIDEVVLGAANQAGEDNRNVARMAALLAGLPDTVPGYTVNRLCASGLTAIVSAANQIRAGEADLIVAGGVESMTRAPWVMQKPGTPWARPGEVVDTSLGWRFTNPVFKEHDKGAGRGPEDRRITLSMGETAEEVAALDGITRAESDAFALRSHDRAIAAIDAGRFAGEIVPVGDASTDEIPRRGSTLEKLGGLKTVFRAGGVVTAGSSSPLSDGAAALVVASRAAVERYGLTPRARVVTAASAGVPPQLMGLGPVPATEKALDRVGWATTDLDAVELNEAFAVQSLAVIRRLKLDEERVNADGGAIALGHPLGCSGARITVTLLGRMERENARRGLATLCVGVGQGVAMLLERP